MMPLSKNTITIALMTTSIVLLLFLQFLWLRDLYRQAGADFHRETNTLFRNTLIAMHDSLIRRNIEPVWLDSARPGKVHGRIFLKDTVERISRVEIVTEGIEKDSLLTFMRPFTARLSDGGPQTYVFRLGSDSLRIDSIEVRYYKVLQEAGIRALFEVKALRVPKETPTFKSLARRRERFTSDVVSLGPFNQFSVSFHNVEKLLLARIMPQIFFSLFLTSLIAAAFYIMYRNLSAQQQLMRIKNDFISNVTHELKTPVATASVAIEALRNFNVMENPTRTNEYLDMAQNELSRLSLITDNILKTAVFEERGVQIRFEQLDLDAMVQKVLDSMTLLFEKKNITVHLQKSGSDFVLTGSAPHLTNVIYNLVDNAVKYSPEGGPIEVRINGRPDDLQLAVRDTGIGIEQQYKSRIFEKFFRVPNGDVHNTKGYGLGLNYVAAVVKSHNGTIEVESAPGKGSCFTVSLPRRHEDAYSVR